MASSAGVDPVKVVLELTETIRPRDLDLAGEVAVRLRRLGFSLWLDDFGTGWSGLSDLLHFPVDGIKIDRPFAQRLGSATADAVIAATTGLAEKLGLTVTIEGIEERRQATQAQALGCHLGQGFLWPRDSSAAQARRRSKPSPLLIESGGGWTANLTPGTVDCPGSHAVVSPERQSSAPRV